MTHKTIEKNGFKVAKWVSTSPALSGTPKKRSRHKEPRLLGTCDQQLLRERHAVQAQLHSKVPPGHHEGLGFGDDAIDVGQSLYQRKEYQVATGWVKDGQGYSDGLAVLPCKPEKKVLFV